MKDKFRVGQKVRIVLRTSKHYGEVVTVVSPRKNIICDDFITNTTSILYLYLVDMPPSGIYISFGYLEEDLEPIYDGDEKSSWSKCAWKPSELVKNG